MDEMKTWPAGHSASMDNNELLETELLARGGEGAAADRVLRLIAIVRKNSELLARARSLAAGGAQAVVVLRRTQRQLGGERSTEQTRVAAISMEGALKQLERLHADMSWLEPELAPPTSGPEN